MNHTELLSNHIEISRTHCTQYNGQIVERRVKLVTEASARVQGEDRVVDFIRASLKARDSMPLFESKSQYIKKKKTDPTKILLGNYS